MSALRLQLRLAECLAQHEPDLAKRDALAAAMRLTKRWKTVLELMEKDASDRVLAMHLDAAVKEIFTIERQRPLCLSGEKRNKK